ncbi:hypothetical protein [Haliscomenobacter hydrossis]|uniref:Uncharacterized protein n=1 Tax=Haliscomenobacter hydrossis (strain ATCC 27775 / DSM 1100 / LMG 10767 / O) TaxID=760192 RepID=F4L8E8_HALH1|nr:hypothetical protein [Haliscomenobacter hydrossis]AEE54656.1 hypothetical protein Halhy_6847 [Haliscomenobacter hydrossis DSM 1100]
MVNQLISLSGMLLSAVSILLALSTEDPFVAAFVKALALLIGLYTLGFMHKTGMIDNK